MLISGCSSVLTGKDWRRRGRRSEKDLIRITGLRRGGALYPPDLRPLHNLAVWQNVREASSHAAGSPAVAF